MKFEHLEIQQSTAQKSKCSNPRIRNAQIHYYWNTKVKNPQMQESNDPQIQKSDS